MLMYVLVITLGLCSSYLLFYWGITFFLENRLPKVTSKSIVSLGVIVVLSILANLLASSIDDIEFSNRIEHAVGGGVMAGLVCFLAIKDSAVSMRKFQFVVLSILLATALGVMNEILEFFLQNYFGFISADNINDTWLDLVSNTVGILFATLTFTPFVNKKISKTNISNHDGV